MHLWILNPPRHAPSLSLSRLRGLHRTRRPDPPTTGAQHHPELHPVQHVVGDPRQHKVADEPQAVALVAPHDVARPGRRARNGVEDRVRGQLRRPRRGVERRGARVEAVEEVRVEFVLLGVRDAAVRGVDPLLLGADFGGDGARLEERDGDLPLAQLQAQRIIKRLESVFRGGVRALVWSGSGCTGCVCKYV